MLRNSCFSHFCCHAFWVHAEAWTPLNAYSYLWKDNFQTRPVLIEGENEI